MSIDTRIEIGTSIPATFPNELAGRVAYAESVDQAVHQLPTMSLIAMRQFRDKVVWDVGRNRLAQAEETSHTPCLNYYLWAKEHPTCDLIFRIISLGIVHLVAKCGQSIYEENAPVFDLVQSLTKIGHAEGQKQAEVDGIKDTVFRALRAPFAPRQLVDLLSSLRISQGVIDGTTASLVSNYLNRHSGHFLDSPNTYTDQELYNDVTNVYSLININNEHLRTLKQIKEVYVMASFWKELPFDDKLALLETMQPNPNRFAPVLLEIINETKNFLTWDRFCELTDGERQEIITLVNIILAIDNLDARYHLSHALTALREHIRSSYFKNCQWDDQGSVAVLQSVCDSLDIIDEFRVASNTQRIEKLWTEIPYAERRENSELLVADHKHYEEELDRRRKETFALVEGIKGRSLEDYEYVVEMIRLLKPVFTEGCERALKVIEVELLASIKDSINNPEQQRALSLRGRILGLETPVVSDLANDGILYSFGMYLWSGGKRREQRIQEAVAGDLLHKGHQMRELGIPTPIDHVPKEHELAKYQIAISHLKVGPPTVPHYAGNINLLELSNFVDLADKAGVIPAELVESTSDTSSQTFRKREVIQAISELLKTLQRGVGLSDRLTLVQNVLCIYTEQVKERLKQATGQKDKHDIYIELVDLVCKELGFACMHCEDRKVNAAMMIFNEKVVDKNGPSGTSQKNVLEWLARKRDILVTGMLQEMIQENMNNGFMVRLFSDVSSSISRWRYVCRRQLGLGDVPSPAHSITSGLTEELILARFNKTYTAKWILEQAMEDHAKKVEEGGHPALKIIPIGDYLESRISNFNDIRLQLLNEESFELLKEGMALYLQEIGVYSPIV